MTPVGALALALGLVAIAQEPPDRPEAASSAEVDAWRSARARFAARADEIRADALATLQRQRAAQVGQVTAAYDARVDTAGRFEAQSRGEAIAAFESFLRRYDDVRATSDVRLRLAELYFQEAEDAWLVESRAYFAALDSASEGKDAAGPEPKIDLTRVIELLDAIVAANRGLPAESRYPLLDVAYSMLAFAYGEPNSRQFDKARARQVFGELIRERPDSDYADAAHLMLGTYAFEENRYADSIPEFEAVLAQGPQRRNYGAALYQLSWARYKLSDYDAAMRGFVALLDASEARRASSGQTSEFAPDAITYLALSLLELADAQSVTPRESAQGFFATLGPAPSGVLARPWRWDVYTSLAESLVTYSRPREAIDVYRALTSDPEWALRPENPEFQDTIVKLLSRGYDADLAAAGQARIDLTERYGPGSMWWDANRADPEAQGRARRYAEAYLLDVAIEQKVRAQESGDAATYSLAADKYKEYLSRFPIADDYYANQFQLADALYRAARLDEAADAYGDLVRSAKFHAFGDAATYMVFRTREQLLRQRVGSPDQRAPNVEIERTYVGPGGQTVQVYELLDDQKAFVSAADEVVARTYGAPVDGLDVGALVSENKAKILYLPAQVLYYANHFDAARPRLQKIIKEHPDSDEAAFAANLFLNSYVVEGDAEAIRRWSKEFAGLRLGKSELAAKQGTQFQDTYEKASYQLGLDASKRGDFAAAAEAYLRFVTEFPKSKIVPDALLSAAANYDRLGRVAEANKLYERFLREYPTHPDAKPFYFRIASNYESAFELDKAIPYYRAFVDRYPTSDEARNAQYMVAFLEEGLGNALAAAKGYEDYARRFAAAPDREDVHFRAGAMYELADREKAIGFYRSYLKAYGTKNPDHAIAAQARIAALHQAAGRTREAESARDDVVRLFERIAASGQTIGPAGRDAAAEAGFRGLRARFEALAGRKLSRNEAKDTKLLLDELPAEIKAFDQAATTYVEKYLSFEWTTAAAYLQGAARQAYAKLGFGVEPPDGLSEDEQAAYWELLEETLFPQMRGVEAQAVEFFQRVLSLAAAQKRTSRWVDEARSGMATIDPTTYPTPKEPLLGRIQAIQPPALVPAMPAPAEEGK